MDNEASTALLVEITNIEIKYQFLSPSNHRENNVEVAIQTFKTLVIAGILRVDKKITPNCGTD